MNETSASRWLHRFAWGTAVLTLLLPVASGAVVTTLDAGMAFLDWPSSDGYSMVMYPWLKATRDKFYEHGHRLAGMTIGLVSIALAIYAWMVDSRRAVRIMAAAIFGSVFVQGMLGGARVRMDERAAALIHGDFAAAVFGLMCLFVLITGSGWETRPRMVDRSPARNALLVACVLTASLMIQYYMGGVLRHFKSGWAWAVHPWFALVPVVIAPLFVGAARRCGSMRLVRLAVTVCGLIGSQALLGLATWYVSKGFPAWGVVARQGSLEMVLICSLHKVLGMLTLAMSVVAVASAAAMQPSTGLRETRSTDLNRSLAGVPT